MPTRGTPTTPFRIPPALKERARRVAASRGETLTDVVVRALKEYAAQEVTPPPPAGQ